MIPIGINYKPYEKIKLWKRNEKYVISEWKPMVVNVYDTQDIGLFHFIMKPKDLHPDGVTKGNLMKWVFNHD